MVASCQCCRLTRSSQYLSTVASVAQHFLVAAMEVMAAAAAAAAAVCLCEHRRWAAIELESAGVCQGLPPLVRLVLIRLRRQRHYSVGSCMGSAAAWWWLHWQWPQWLRVLHDDVVVIIWVCVTLGAMEAWLRGLHGLCSVRGLRIMREVDRMIQWQSG